MDKEKIKFSNTELTLSIPPELMHKINCEAEFEDMEATEFCIALIRIKLLERDLVRSVAYLNEEYERWKKNNADNEHQAGIKE